MKDLNQALAEINTIRTQIARATEFRGYGPVTVAATGLLAIAAAAVQTRGYPDAVHNVNLYNCGLERHGGSRNRTHSDWRW
jgi:hypothetical protein